MKSSPIFLAAGRLASVSLIAFLALPLVALFFSASVSELRAGAAHPLFLPALLLSLKTSAISLFITLMTGLPLAFWLAHTHSRLKQTVELIVDLPLVIPPAVIGVALLQSLGRRGFFAPVLDQLGVSLAFSSTAVILAQVTVSAPFLIQAANNAFRKVDPEMLIVARTLGASRAEAYFRIALPIALPGLVVGASLAWARSLGEFGATLLFAGNLPGTTQTVPLAIFSALEVDVRLALVFSMILAGVASILLLAIRILPRTFAKEGTSQSKGAKE